METKLLFQDGRLTSDGAYQLLKPHYPPIFNCIASGLNAWQVLQQSAPEVCLPLLPRTRASLIHDNIEEYARRTFAGQEPDIMLHNDTGFLVIDFYGKIIMRFKKLSNALHPCNVKTDQQRAYDHQTLFSSAATLVTAGYRLDSIGMFRDAHIVCWNGHELLWSLRLPDLDVTTEQIDVVSSHGPPQPMVVAKKKTLKKIN